MSARREARALAVVHLDDGTPPAELYDTGHPVWSDDDLYFAFLERHGLTRLPALERMGGHSNPRRRRDCASAAWALRHGVTTQRHADLNRLRAMGIYGDSSQEAS